MIKKVSAEENGQKGFDTVNRVLTSIGWSPQETEFEGVMRVDFGGDKIPISEALADVRIEYERFIYLLIFGERAGSAHREEVAKFLTRANFGLVIGCFEFNLDNGEIRFRSSIDFTSSDLTETLVRNSIRSSMDAVERYGDSIVKVLRGELDAVRALKLAEGGNDSHGTT